jgi:hypothetical protein
MGQNYIYSALALITKKYTQSDAMFVGSGTNYIYSALALITKKYTQSDAMFVGYGSKLYLFSFSFDHEEIHTK